MCPGEVFYANVLAGTTAGGGGFHGQFAMKGVDIATYCAIGARATGTSAISHELVEAITDADLNGWKDRTVNPAKEVADLCSPSTTLFHGYDVSSFWSPQGCVGPIEDNQKICVVVAKIVGGPTLSLGARCGVNR